MATATRKPSSPSPSTRELSPVLERVLGVFDAIYRFLGSLKLAVCSLSALSAVLAYATFFESWYGGTAAQEWIYRSPGFAVLLAFLGANILCAALIRFPWKKRQTGFVITHAGLLVLIAGSWYSSKTADEGQFGMLEGQTMSELYRRDAAAFRVRKIDPETGAPDRAFEEYEMPFHPGTFPWGKGHSRWFDASGWPAHLMSLRSLAGPAEEVISKPRDPFKVVVKSFLPASALAYVGESDASGGPIAKIRVLAKPPGMPSERDSLPADEQWFKPDETFQRLVKRAGRQAPLRVAFQYVDRPEIVDDFLHPPKTVGADGVATFHYKGKDGRSRKYEWPLDGQAGKSVALPESDLTATFEQIRYYPDPGASNDEHQRAVFQSTLGMERIPVASFKVRKGTGEDVIHAGWASLPMLPTAASPEQKLCEIYYDRPPVLDPKTNGLFGLIDVLGDAEGRLYYRVFGRGEGGKPLGQLRSAGTLKKGERIQAFGGNPNMPMSLSFEVEDYFPQGVVKEVYEPVLLPAGKKGEGVGACLVALTIDDKTKEFWVQGSFTLEKSWQRVSFPSGVYEVAFDVDRKALGFQLTLEDFQRGFDPGTEQPSRFQSSVALTDPESDLKNKRITISMNNPLSHRGYTFYQSSYQAERDPRSLEETGRFMSILQVATDPGRPVKYAGCLLIVLGAFVQFYMRAGIFTDGGKKEQARVDAQARKRAGAKGTLSQNGQAGTGVADVSESEEAL